MKSQHKRKNRIAKRLIGGVVIFSLLVTMTTTLVEIYRDHQQSLNEIEESLTQIRSSNLPSIINAVWVLDVPQIQAQLDGLARQKDIAHLEIMVNNEVLWEAGTDSVEHVIEKDFSLDYEYREKIINIGTLRIHANLDNIYQHLIDKASVMLISNSIMVFLLAGFIVIFFHYLVSRHLYALLNRVLNFQLNSSSSDFKLNKKTNKNGPDELDQLVAAFNQMQTEVNTSYQELLTEKERSQVTLASIGDGVIVTDKSGLIESINPIASALTKWLEKDAIGKPVADIFHTINEVTRQAEPNPIDLVISNGVMPRIDKQTVLVGKSGIETAIEGSAAPIIHDNDEIIGAILVFHDVTNSRKLSRELSWQASHDSLTGLVNRREFERLLDEAVDRVEMRNESHILLFLDLDQFKIVNDTCGHPAGDELLKQISSILEMRLRKSDTLARLGGDEFGVLLLDCSTEKGIEIAEGLRKIVEAFRFGWDNKTFRIGTSIGLVEINETNDIKDIMRSADLACYEAKDQGRNRIHIYNNEQGEVRESEMLWINRITDAFDNNRFELYVQPIVGGVDLQVHHYEVLLRMSLEDGTTVPPNMFIPPAERYGIMTSIDRWVISKAFEWLRDNAMHETKLAINLSGASLGDTLLPGFIIQELERLNLQGNQVCFEITETTAIANLSQALQLIQQLKERKCTFALDDFGSGLSSFGYLKSLPVDYLKIDGSFVRDMVDDLIDHAMVQAIHQVGKVMGIETIAEYVENNDVITACQAVGIDYLQGYGVGKPAPIAELKFSARQLELANSM